ncbi:MAG: hypothetical protein WCG80_15800, partial [Spirochaetales bacterium]
MKRLLGTVVAGGLLLASCSLFETTVNRDLRAVWSPDGAGLLVVGSQYTTLHPEEPYFNATSGHDWQVILETADVNAANPLAARTPLDSFAEGGEAAPVAQGGDAQYNPVYWYPELKRVIFTGPLAQVRDVVAHTSWMVPLPPSEPLTGQL